MTIRSGNIRLKPVIFAGLIFLYCGILASTALSQYQREYVVAKDGSGDFTSIQAAIDASKSFPYDRITIHIKNGIYKEKVKVHSWNTRLSLVGESQGKTIITYADHFDKIDVEEIALFLLTPCW